MDDGGDSDKTTIDINELLESPKPPPSQQPPPTRQDPTLEELIAQCSTELIHTFAASINQSATTEARKTEEFRQEFKRRLFRAIVRTYVWSTARLAHETESAEERLTKGVQELLAAERDQGRSSPPTILGRQTLLSLVLRRALGTIVAADLVRQGRLCGRLSELMAAVRKAAEAFAQF